MQDDVASLFNIHQIGTLPLNANQLRQKTRQDPVLTKVLSFTQNGLAIICATRTETFFQQKIRNHYRSWVLDVGH